MCSGINSLGRATRPRGKSGKSRTSGAMARAYRQGASVPARHGSARPLRAARPAGRRPAAAPHRRAHAARRTGGELLVPAPPRGLRLDRAARARPPRGRPRVRGGIRERGAGPDGRVGRRRGRQPRRVRARAPEVHRRPRAVRARHDRDLDRGRGLRRVPPDDRARAGSRAGARAPARPDRAGRRRLRLDAQRAHARSEGRGALRQPVARARVPARRLPRAVRAPLRPGRPARPVPCPQAPAARARDPARRLGRDPSAPGRDEAVLRPLHARDLRTRLRAAAPRARRRPRPARRPAPMSRAGGGGALALVLHTHMPYVEGFGTWPFGEEWLWEAVATCYLPLLDVLDAAPGRVTLSVTPVLGDQLEADGALERCAAFLRKVRPESHRRDIAAARDAGVAAALEYSAARYATAADALE